MGKRRVKGKLGEYGWSSELSRIVPLQGGWCYLRDVKVGKTYHLKVGSDRFNELVAELTEVLGEKRMAEELKKVGIEND